MISGWNSYGFLLWRQYTEINKQKASPKSTKYSQPAPKDRTKKKRILVWSATPNNKNTQKEENDINIASPLC